MQPTGTDTFGKCANHSGVEAVSVCPNCGKPICSDCEYRAPDGRLVCLECIPAVAGKTAGGAPPPILTPSPAPAPVPTGLKCIQHSGVSAVQVCRLCAAPMCATCDFLMSGNVHLCPVCVVAPPRKISRGRKSLLITAYILAAWNTLGLVLLTSGAFANYAREERAAAGLLILLLIHLPTVIGVAVCLSIFDRRLRTPGSVWGATIWNGLIALILGALFILGILRR